MSAATLFTFILSHFSEKARWALDVSGRDYTEVPLLPGLHQRRIQRYGTQSFVPLLLDADGPVQGSGPILDHLEATQGPLFGADPALSAEIRALESRADLAFGLGTQRIAYDVLLDYPADVAAAWTQGFSTGMYLLYRLLVPLSRSSVRALYSINGENLAASQAAFRALFQDLDARLAQQDYLLGAQPTRIDLSVAALLAPLCQPAGHVTEWRPLPEPLQPFLSEFRGRPTWTLVHRMYQLHRRPQAG